MGKTILCTFFFKNIFANLNFFNADFTLMVTLI